MRWKITIEGMDEFGGRDIAEMLIERQFSQLANGEIGLTLSDGKTIMARLQQFVVKQQCEAYVLTRRYCADCQTFRRIKDYGKRRIRTVYGRVEVDNPRIMNCQRCLPHFCAASAVLRDICPDQATAELMELSARMGSLMPYRKAADVLAEFLPIPSTESFMTLRHRTMKLGERLDEKARDRAWFEPPSSSEHEQVELDLPNDPKREFVVSIDTAHVRGSRSEKARNFEIAVARCGRGRRGSPPGHYFATADTSKDELRLRTLQALQQEGYVGRGELTVISDGAEIMKRLPKALPKPTLHILDWFHIAMKIQPLQQMADYVVRVNAERNGAAISLGDDIRSVKWKLWHGQPDRAIDRLEAIITALLVQKPSCRWIGQASPRSRAAPTHLHPFQSNRHRRLRRAISIGPTDRFFTRLIDRQFPRCPPDGQKAADAMVAPWRAPHIASAGSPPQLRPQRTLGLAASRAVRRQIVWDIL
jgi:hypothetical protein